MNIAHRSVAISATERIEFDFNQGRYRVAYYRHVLEDKKIIGERRFSAMKPKLNEALTTALGEADADHDPDLVEHYFRSQPWGRELP